MSPVPQITQYGRYQVQSEIGRGSMGVVYKALDPKIDRVIALKVLKQHHVTDSDMVKRFLREAKAAGRLSQSNIVMVHDVGQDHGTVYIAMELVEGEGLDSIIKKGHLHPDQAIDITLQVAVALDYAHKQQIVHRDIKPSNIIVTPGGEIKITDFGIARIVDAPGSEQTQVGSILGTPSYMSPEQVRGQRVDGRSDLFSLGTILYEMITGEKPFKGSNLLSIFHAIATVELPPLSSHNANVPGKLEKVISKALHKDPDNRFQTGAEFAEALENCANGLALESTPADQKYRAHGINGNRLSIYLVTLGIALAVISLIALWWFDTVPDRKPTGTRHEQAIVNMGELFVQTNPSGAEVAIDGVKQGLTPLTLNLKTGPHYVVLTKAGYYPWEAEVKIKETETVPLELDLIQKDMP